METTPLEENLHESSRRERMKLNQRAYRRRHASKFKTLQGQAERLRKALREITAAASASGQQLPPDLVAALEKSSQLVREDGEDDADGQDAVPVEAAMSRQDDTSWQLQDGLGPSITRETSFLTVPPLDAGNASSISLLPTFSGPLSPRLDYGLWPDPDPLIKTFDAPPDIAPYLGAAQSTLSGYIFWYTHTYLQSIWDASGLARPANNDNNSGRVPAQRQATARHLIHAMFSHSRHLTDHVALAAIGRARLAFRRQGCLRLRAAEHTTIYRMPEVLHQRVIQELFGGYADADHAYTNRTDAAPGVLAPSSSPLASLWNTPEQVEVYIFGSLTSSESALVRAIMGRNHRCFGSGPRWNGNFCVMAVGLLTKWLRREYRGPLAPRHKRTTPLASSPENHASPPVVPVDAAPGGGRHRSAALPGDRGAIGFMCAALSPRPSLAASAPTVPSSMLLVVGGRVDVFRDFIAAFVNLSDTWYDFNLKGIIIAGQSAGATLAAGVTHLAHDRLLRPPIDAQTEDQNEIAWTARMGGINGMTNTPPYVEPARAKVLKHLPPAHSGVGDYDLLRNESRLHHTDSMESLAMFKTDYVAAKSMGVEQVPDTLKESTRLILAKTYKATREEPSGKFFTVIDGNQIPW
ncbi:hypothetical protein S7711_08494 [Stachybotrys chartarum IBT 7711]|uniref:Alpha/beta hydrolase fold-3 domain-containing protein n=1 Tax=Stachybotrys chartarum (strain CBS 109288 / IBT 7711) TaxID=1280523 RepID=A0A084BCP6_STACB|nr:hypothetical protein S7711_08494 [Stachybotrys chartarum IBT 7711]